MSRSIIIDDSDSGIVYSGAWFTDNSGALDAMGNWGPPMLGTLHGTNSTASLTYNFSGTELIVLNSNQFNNLTGLHITCLLDNESVPVVISVDNVRLCSKDGLADTEHTFVLKAEVTIEETFWFDYLTYAPSASVPLTQAPLLIGQNDTQLQAGMSTGWKTFHPGIETTQTGAQFTFAFTGVSLTYYGFYDPSLPWDTSLNTATYSVDGGSPVSFNTQTDATGSVGKPQVVRHNQLLFQTADLPNGNHTLEVTYHGTNTSTPLTLEFLVVDPNPRDGGGAGATASVVRSNTPPSHVSTATSSILPSSSPSSRPPKTVSNLGAIAGAVVGALALVLLLLVSSILLRRRRGRRVQWSTGVLAPDVVEPSLPVKRILSMTQRRAYAPRRPLENRSTHSAYALSIDTNTDMSYVAWTRSGSRASDPFSDDTLQYVSTTGSSSSHLQLSPSYSVHGRPYTCEAAPTVN